MPFSTPLPAEPRPGRYRHYKGKEYFVVDIARHTETEEVFVVYRQLYGDGAMWVRPHAMFTETVQLPDGRAPRFAYIAEK
jgi:hypothetical protein